MKDNSGKTLTGNPDPIPMDGPTNETISFSSPGKSRDVVKVVAGLVGGAIVLAAIGFMTGIDFRRTQMTYDPAREISVQGVIVGFEEFSCPASGGELGMHMQVNTGTKVYQVHLAASRILRQQHIHFEVGQQVEVRGAVVRFHGQEGILAKTVAAGDYTFHLRQADGTPLL